ncbi:MAG: arginine--tRNA ligase [Christensenellaceae bacterium]|nr:arginine--tRNA ligase [Christensenellaceae bacterium]MBR3843040.1 arginine--tRNA ligase [Christensenellaceae bacterium]
MDFKDLICSSIAKAAELPIEDIEALMETPPDKTLGDFAFPCFKLARTLRKAPPMIAQDIASKIEKPDFVSEIKTVGAYINFFVDRSIFGKDTIEKAQREGEAYGSSTVGGGKTIVLDYSSINIAKPFHIGHLLTTVIGNSLYRIYEFMGYKSFGVNHLGDWGTQFGKLISAYKRWGDKEEIERDGIKGLLRIYVKFHKEAEEHPELEDEARAYFKDIEDGDEDALALFHWFKDLTLKDVGRVYDMLGVHFDSYNGESFYNDKMQPVIDELAEKGLLEESEGAMVVNLDKYELPPCLILKSNGTTLYATRDLAAAFYRKNTYDFDKCLYVVAYQQNLHFKQLFSVIELMGYDWAKDMVHVNFGMVSMQDGSMSTREGRVVFLEEVLNAAIEKTRAIIEEKNPGIKDKETVSRQIGVGAVIFSALYSGRIKDMVFDYDRVLNFDGETAPYVQYCHTRCRSVLAKAGDKYELVEPDWSVLSTDGAFEVVSHIADFGNTVAKACEKNEPSVISHYVVELAQLFNKYYYDYRIIDENENATAARLRLTKVTADVIKKALWLLGIETPAAM